jgi:hypothetical protein
MTSEKVKAWFKKYWPWLAGGAGVIILYLLFVNRQTASQQSIAGATGTVSPSQPTGPTAAQVQAETQLESAQITAQQRVAEATLQAQTAQTVAQLNAQTAQVQSANQLAAQQAGYAASTQNVRAQTGAQTTGYIIQGIGQALPSILRAFQQPAGTVQSFDTTFPYGAVQAGTAVPYTASGVAPASDVAILPGPSLLQDQTQASTIILPTPTFDSQGPPLEAFVPAIGGVSASPDFGFLL